MRLTTEQKNLYIQLGKRVYMHRMKKDLTQEELGAAVDANGNYISRTELGQNQIRIHKLIEIANALEVPVEEFLP